MARQDEDVLDPADYEGKLPKTGDPGLKITDGNRENFVRGMALASKQDPNEVRDLFGLPPLEPEALQEWLDGTG